MEVIERQEVTLVEHSTALRRLAGGRVGRCSRTTRTYQPSRSGRSSSSIPLSPAFWIVLSHPSPLRCDCPGPLIPTSLEPVTLLYNSLIIWVASSSPITFASLP